MVPPAGIEPACLAAADFKFAEAMRDAMNDPMALAALRSADKHKRGDKPADDGA